jgi:hypothetical protein
VTAPHVGRIYLGTPPEVERPFECHWIGWKPASYGGAAFGSGLLYNLELTDTGIYGSTWNLPSGSFAQNNLILRPDLVNTDGCPYATTYMIVTGDLSGPWDTFWTEQVTDRISPDCGGPSGVGNVILAAGAGGRIGAVRWLFSGYTNVSNATVGGSGFWYVSESYAEQFFLGRTFNSSWKYETDDSVGWTLQATCPPYQLGTVAAGAANASGNVYFVTVYSFGVFDSSLPLNDDGPGLSSGSVQIGGDLGVLGVAKFEGAYTSADWGTLYGMWAAA